MSRLAGRILRFVELLKVIRDVPLAVIGSAVIYPFPTLRRLVEGADPHAASRRYAVYASFDRNSLIDNYVVEQVAAVARLGYRIIFVSTSPRWLEDQVAKIRPYCWKILSRRNLGHDFASYKQGIQQIGSLDDVEQLLLMNDSCYGPLFDLGTLEALGTANGANLWGITDSWFSSYHIQSYFMVFDRRAVCSRTFHRFWAFLPPYQTRRLAIRTGEVRLTKWLVRSGMRATALCPYQAVASTTLRRILKQLRDSEADFLPTEKLHLQRLAEAISKGVKLNPMHSFWDVLIAEYRCPFIKRNLLRENPARIPGLIEWPELIATHTGYPAALISEHLKVS